MDPIRINLIGNPGSGKSTLAKHLEIEYGFKIFRPSDVLREYAKTIGITLRGRDDYIRVHQIMNDSDPEAIPNAILNHPADKLCLDGLRTPRHVQDINCHTVALVCPDKDCFDHLMNAKSERTGRDISIVSTVGGMIEDRRADEQMGDLDRPSTPLVMMMAESRVFTGGEIEDAKASLGGIVRQLTA